MYQDYMALGIMPTDSNTACYISVYQKASTDQLPLQRYDNNSMEELQNLRTDAHRFRMVRAQCRGHCRLRSAGISLIGGNCSTSSTVESTVLHDTAMTLFAHDTLPSPLAFLPGLCTG